MGKFSKIKKYSKPSLVVNGKIKKLNRELKKTGMLSEIANSTSDLYSVTSYTEPVPAVPPTISNVPDTSGVTDLLSGSFEQNDVTNDNTGYNDASQLFNPGIGADPTPILYTPSATPPGGVGFVWHTYTLNGEAVGYIGAGNKFKQVLNPSISGGTDTDYDGFGYVGGNYYTQMALRQSFAEAYSSMYLENAEIGKVITWQCWVPFNSYGFGSLYNEYSGIKKIDADGAWGLANVIIRNLPNPYQSDPGSPEQPGYYTLISKNGLGDPNYYPGPIPPPNTNIAKGEVNWNVYDWMNKTYGLPAAEWYQNNPGKPPSSNPFLPKGAYVPLAMGNEVMNKLNMSQEAASTLIAGALSGQRNSSGSGPIDARGPYTPVKDYGGWYGPSGPSRDPWDGKGPLGPIPVQGV